MQGLLKGTKIVEENVVLKENSLGIFSFQDPKNFFSSISTTATFISYWEITVVKGIARELADKAFNKLTKSTMCKRT